MKGVAHIAPLELLLLAASFTAACAEPRHDVATADVPKLTSLRDLMVVQSTVADAPLKKRTAASFTDADYASFTEVSDRIQATSTKAKEFSKGPGFEKLADQLHENAVALGKAAAAKDRQASAASLAAMQATCNDCHAKFD